MTRIQDVSPKKQMEAVSRQARLGAALFVALVVAIPGPVAAACDARIVDVELRQSSAYDPFQVQPLVLEREIRIESVGDDDCAFRLAFHRDQPTNATLGGEIGYDLLDADGNSLLASTRATDEPDTFLETARLARGVEAGLGYRWRVERGQQAAAGRYTDEIELRLFEAGSANQVASARLSLAVDVAGSFGINLAGADVTSPFNHSMDFGVLERGASREVRVDVRSSQRYVLQLQSEHGGELVHRELDRWQVPYSLTLDGSVIPLGAVHSEGPFEPTPSTGRSKSLRVMIGETAGRRAGTYGDTITIRIEPAP